MASEPSSVIDSYLPRCGFKDVAHFDTLRKSNPFIFRVYTPKERSPFSDDTDPYFVAPKFDELYARSPDDLKQISFTEALSGSYADVAKHMDWTTRSSSRYLSTSFSFGWAIWEAAKRYHSGMKKDVEIAIIDANALGGRAATAVELLLKSNSSERDDQFWKWHKFSKDSQSVLVYGFVPRSAVLASVPLLQILRKMPSYFLRDDIQILPENPLTQAAWDYTNRKSSYRHFCQDMSKVFLSRPQEVRLRDTTGGAVRLALAFLRPYFHQVVQEDFDQAISHLRRLALIIARWPSESWIQEHPEVFNIVESMALSLGEELLYQGRTKSEEVSRLRFKIVGLEDALQSAHSSFYVEREHVRAEPGPNEVSLPDNERMVESDEHTLVNSDLLPPISLAVKKPLSLETAVPIFAPRVPPAFQTPITPPESPRNSIFVPSTPTTSSEVPDVAPITPPPTRISPWSSWVPPQVEITPPPRLGSPFKLLPAFELASPPTTPPPNIARHAVFSPPLLGPILETVVEVDPEREDENVVIVPSQPPVIEEHLHSIPEETDEEEGDNEETRDEQSDQEDDDKTDCEEEAEGLPGRHKRHRSTDSEGIPGLPSPGITSWVHIRPSSALTSPRLSISSIDTLIDSPEYHPKRGSISVSYPEPFSFLRRISSITMVEGRSRTVSFSGLSAATTEPVSEEEVEEREGKSAALDNDERSPVDESLNVPLPPSPSLSECTLSSLESESLDLPSPHSPQSPEGLASVPSTSGSEEGHTRDDNADVEGPVTTTVPVPGSPHTGIIPPKHGVSLLQPIEIDDEDEDALGRLSERTTIALADTASYIVTGFIVGAFITIFLFSTQRRALLSLT